MKKGKGNFGKAKLLKRGLALLLAALMVESVTADTGLLYVSAREALTLQEAAGSQEAESGQGQTQEGSKEENKDGSEEGQEENGNGSEEGQGEKENGSGEEQENQSTGNAASKQGAETAESTGESASIKGREPEANAVAGAADLWDQLTAAFRPMTAYAAEPESQKESEEQTKQQTIEAEQKVAKNSTGTGADTGRKTGTEAGKETETNANMAKKEGALVELTLTGIQWKLDPAESDFPQFDGSRNGAVYAYNPVLPAADREGRAYVLSEDTKLPVIYVLVGEMQVMLLSGNELDSNTLPLSTKLLSKNASIKEDA